MNYLLPILGLVCGNSRIGVLSYVSFGYRVMIKGGQGIVPIFIFCSFEQAIDTDSIPILKVGGIMRNLTIFILVLLSAY